MFSEITNTAMQVALGAGKILLDGFGSDFKIDSKEGRNNLVTEYDKKSEKYIIDTISKAFPTHSFLAEESGKSQNFHTDDIIWVVDPLDGTVNFAHNLPIFSVSIAAVKNNEILTGVVYHPILNELFVAEKGKGAFLNDKPISVSKNADLATSFLVTGFPYDPNTTHKKCICSFSDFIGMGIPVRRLGSAALDLAYVANGRFDGFWEIKLNPWDVAAGILLVREAGGKVTQYDGTEAGINDESLVATNSLIHNDITKVVNN